ncbi:hypothetical protein BRY73_23435 [Ochrobactrum sp. P6BS-III]|uniref:hypothetical protein n=1 Tax=unclassified Ochrobactrum TaxID=239106 RepID=UPI0009930297|nr:hypothetical protein [Ochrobactrum sp. P6BSIII]OOL14660.1 hypothetical protein BRY73_23435 [Ochrobactrum sp. P6BS-III]
MLMARIHLINPSPRLWNIFRTLASGHTAVIGLSLLSYYAIEMKQTVSLHIHLAGTGDKPTMKSWGERLVAGLKNWRSHKGDSAVSEVPDIEGESADRLQQPDAASHAKLSIKVTTKRHDETAFRPDPDGELEYSPVAAVDKPQADEAPSSLGQPGRNLAHVDLTASSSGKKPAQKRARARKSPSEDQSTAKKVLAIQTAEEGAETDAATPSQINSEASSQASAPPKKPLTPFDPTLQSETTTSETTVDENRSAQRVSVSMQKRSRDRKPNVSNGQVTDSELAELEAENARLKLLLKERLEAKKSSSHR